MPFKPGVASNPLGFNQFKHNLSANRNHRDLRIVSLIEQNEIKELRGIEDKPIFTGQLSQENEPTRTDLHALENSDQP